MLRRRGTPCTQILDPRFRDAGIGVSARRGVMTTLAVELGLRAGARAPSKRTKPASSCPHRVPAPVISGAAVTGEGSPVASDTAVTVVLRCLARVACSAAAKLTLPAGAASSPFQAVTIPAKATTPVVFELDPAAIATELAAPRPQASLLLTLSEPAQYTDTLSAPLTR